MKEKMGGFKTNPPKPSQNSPTAIATTRCRTMVSAASNNRWL